MAGYRQQNHPGWRGGGEDVRYRQLSVTPGAAAGLRCRRSGCIDERGCAGDYAAGTPQRAWGGFLSAGGTGARRYGAGLPYPADRLHQFHFRIRQCQRDVKRKFAARSANRQRQGVEGAGGLAAQPSGYLGGYFASGRTGGALSSSRAFLCREVRAGRSARREPGTPAGCHFSNRAAAAGSEGRTHL